MPGKCDPYHFRQLFTVDTSNVSIKESFKMKQLLLNSLALGKDLLLLKGQREMYVLLALKGAGAFAVGVIVGSLL
jgi:hypothetical protein